MKQRMKRGLWIGVILLVVISLLCLFCCQVILTLVTAEISKSENPPATFQASDLVGIWEASYGHRGDYIYGKGSDRLILRADGTFKQIYENQAEDYVYETPWNEWSVEHFSDGRVHVHLKGARYYLAGIREAEQEGVWPTSSSLPVTGGEPESFHDPFDPERRYRSVHMVGELILNIRVLPSGKLVLAHMWCSPNWGFGDADLFHQVETSPLRTPAP